MERVLNMAEITVIGIDLGTTNSVVAYTDDNGVTQAIASDQNNSRMLPSAVFIEQDGGITVGQMARSQAVVEPDRVGQFFKRGMGQRIFRDDDQPFVVDGTEWTPEKLSAMVLAKLKKAAEQHLGHPISRAVVTVPAYFGAAQVDATKKAADMAGFEHVDILEEPVAAAIAHKIDRESEGKLLVYDLGGGTFDVTIMHVDGQGNTKVLAKGGDRRLGGVDFDNLIMDKMAEAAGARGDGPKWADPYEEQDARQMAETMKIELSSRDSSTKRLDISGNKIPFTLTAAEFADLLSPRMEEIEDHVLNTLSLAGMSPGDLTAVIMVGGSSRIPVLTQQLEKLVGHKPQLSANLDEDVARGAAIFATKLRVQEAEESGLATDLTEQIKDLADNVGRVENRCAHALGVTTQTVSGALVNTIVITGNTIIPAKGEQIFFTVADNQTMVQIVLNEGDETDLEYVQELGKSEGHFDSPKPKGFPIRVVMEYTAEQMILVSAYEKDSGRFLCDLRVQHAEVATQNEVEQAKQYFATQIVR